MNGMPALLASWHLSAGDPTVLGWATTAGYALAVVLCLRTARTQRKLDRQERLAWFFLAAILFALGLNKELDLQTWMFDVGRRLAQSEGWYGRRRLVQACFSFGLVLLSAAFFLLVRKQFLAFARSHPAAAAGLLMLCLFVLMRAASADHLWRFRGQEYDDAKWSWILEVGALVMVMRAAVGANKGREA